MRPPALGGFHRPADFAINKHPRASGRARPMPARRSGCAKPFSAERTGEAQF